MAKITGKNTKPEMIVRSILGEMGYRYRLHKKNLSGKPDIVLSKYKTVIFVHGCYWHRHKGCSRGKSMPSTNKEFWQKKFEGTIIRDSKTAKILKQEGWNVITLWQCELTDKEAIKIKLTKALSGL